MTQARNSGKILSPCDMDIWSSKRLYVEGYKPKPFVKGLKGANKGSLYDSMTFFQGEFYDYCIV